ATARHCAARQARTRGLVTPRRMAAARPMRSRVAPGAPVTGNSRIASVAPTCSDVHDPSTNKIADAVPPLAAEGTPGAAGEADVGGGAGAVAGAARVGEADVVIGAVRSWACFYIHRCITVSSSECFRAIMVSKPDRSERGQAPHA